MKWWLSARRSCRYVQIRLLDGDSPPQDGEPAIANQDDSAVSCGQLASLTPPTVEQNCSRCHPWAANGESQMGNEMRPGQRSDSDDMSRVGEQRRTQASVCEPMLPLVVSCELCGGSHTYVYQCEVFCRVMVHMCIKMGRRL